MGNLTTQQIAELLIGIARAQQEQERAGKPLPEMLLRLGYCNEEDPQRAFAEK